MLSALLPRERLVVKLRLGLGLKPEEAADLMRLQPATLWKTLMRARRKLRALPRAREAQIEKVN